ncbi:carbohydrate esterase family 8 protein, partial [Viridothelium virens]
MKVISYLRGIILSASLASATSRTSPPAGALVVNSNASSGQYKTVSAAVKALSTSSTSAQSIFIYPGTYSEQVAIPALKGLLTIYGSTTDTSSYTSNSVTITNGASQASGLTDDGTGTLRAETSAGFKLYNVNLANSYGSGSQALALSSNAGNQGFYGCKFTGYQDTVMAETGYSLFAKSYISGNTDFIFGQHGQTWLDGVDIRVDPTSLGYVT